MKKSFCLLFASVLFLALTSCEKTGGELDLSGCKVASVDNVLQYIGDEYMSQNLNIYVSKNPYGSHTVINQLSTEIKSPRGVNWLVFIDLAPLAKWSHECLFRFVNAKNGEVTDVTGYVPPSGLSTDFTQVKKYEYAVQE